MKHLFTRVHEWQRRARYLFRNSRLLPLSGSALHNLVHTQDGFGGFGGGDKDVAFQLQRLEDAELLHITDASLIHIYDGEHVRNEARVFIQ